MAKASNVSGILLEIEVININQFVRRYCCFFQSVYSEKKTRSSILVPDARMQHAPYLAKRGLGVVDAVSSALTKAGYDKETKQQVFIQSDDSAVLSGFTRFKSFKRVLSIEIEISGASKPSLDDIKKVADGVRIHRSSVAQITGYFMTSFTDTVGSLQAANLSVFIGVLKNEFMNLGFDYFADPTVEIVTYSSAVLADGLVTDYPATAAAYFSEYLTASQTAMTTEHSRIISDTTIPKNFARSVSIPVCNLQNFRKKEL
jgi:hypothetical protein